MKLPTRRADWRAVEDLLASLATTRAVFATATSETNWISAYEPGRRLMLETDSRSSWVRVADVKTCWDRFERRGRIHRRDLMEPGRCSAFMLALFGHVAGVRRQGTGKEASLVLARGAGRSA